MGHVTITDTEPREQTTIGATPTTDVSIGYEFFEDDGADIAVYIDNTLQTSGYTINPTAGTEGGYAGGTLVFDSAQTNVTVTTLLQISFKRETDFPTTGAFNITTLNTQLDKLWASLKQIDSRIDRAVRLAESDTVNAASDVLWPVKADRASQFPWWDANGKLTTAAATTDAAVSTFMTTVLDDTTGLAAFTTILTDMTEAAFKALVNLEIGTDVQAYDAQTAKLDEDQAWTKSQYFTPQTNDTSSSGVITFDFTDGNYIEFTLTENLTSITVDGMDAGGTYKIRLTQAAGSAYTVTGWPAAFEHVNGSALAMTTTLGGHTLVIIEAGNTDHLISAVNYE